MKKLIPILFSLFAINCFADSAPMDMQCPPSSALHHLAAGQAWTLDETYKAKGWYVIQTPDANNNYLNGLPGNTPLVAYYTEEQDFGMFPFYISCSYQYGANSYEAILLKSVYPYYELTASGFSHDKAHHDTYDCHTSGDKPEVCTWKVRKAFL